MGSAADHYENEILDSVLGDDHGVRLPATLYLGAFTTIPTDSTFGVEVAAGDYGRIAIANDSTEWPDAIGSQKVNANDQTWAEAINNWGTINGWALLDDIVAAASANIIFWGAVTPGVLIAIGGTLLFPAGSIVVGGD